MVNQVLVGDSPATTLDSSSFTWHDTTQEGDPTKGMSLRVRVEQEDMPKGSMFSWFRTAQAVELNKGTMLKVNVEQECMSTEGQDDSDSELESLTVSDTSKTFEGEPIDREVLERYLKQVKESEGFDIQDFPGLIPGATLILPLLPRGWTSEHLMYFRDSLERIEDMAGLAMGTYNKQNGTKFKVVDIEQVNYTFGVTSVYYITFSAVEVKRCEDEKGSLASLLFNKLSETVADVHIYTVSLLASLSIVLKPWNDSDTGTRARLLKNRMDLKSAPHQASELDLLDENASRMIFQAVVRNDHLYEYYEVKLCRTAA